MESLTNDQIRCYPSSFIRVNSAGRHCRHSRSEIKAEVGRLGGARSRNFSAVYSHK